MVITGSLPAARILMQVPTIFRLAILYQQTLPASTRIQQSIIDKGAYENAASSSSFYYLT